MRKIKATITVPVYALVADDATDEAIGSAITDAIRDFAGSNESTEAVTNGPFTIVGDIPPSDWDRAAWEQNEAEEERKRKDAEILPSGLTVKQSRTAERHKRNVGRGPYKMLICNASYETRCQVLCTEDVDAAIAFIDKHAAHYLLSVYTRDQPFSG